jgi:membrane protease YdiL (CAAX protease family)
MTLLDTRTTTTPRAGARAAARLAWGPALGLHLAPAAAAFGTALLLAPAMRALHLPPGFALTVAFALVLTPLELGVLLTFAHRATGRWSVRAIPAVLAYRRPIGRWWWAVPPLFGVALVLAVAWQPVGDAIGRSLAGVLPGWLLPGFDGTAGVSRTAVIATLLVTLLVDGIVNPTVEELYFRGFLLPRLPVAGLMAVPLSAGLFAAQHYWQPYNWILIFGLQLILTTLVVRSRSVRLGIVMHVLANSVGVLLTLASVLTA